MPLTKSLVIFVHLLGDQQRDRFLHFKIDVAECDHNDILRKQAFVA